MTPCCGLRQPEYFVTFFQGLVVVWQKRATTPVAIMLAPPDHRSTFSLPETVSLLTFARAHPDRLVWQSQVGAGATLEHAHAQAHRRAAFGGPLPIVCCATRPLLSDGSVEVAVLDGYPLRGLRLSGTDLDTLAAATFEAMSVSAAPVNLIVHSDSTVFLVGRSRDELWPGKRAGAAEVAGVLVDAAADRVCISYAELYKALSSVGLSQEQQEEWEERIVARLSGTAPAVHLKKVSGMLQRFQRTPTPAGL